MPHRRAVPVEPHPVLIRLSTTRSCPTAFRGEYRECFIIAPATATSAERAYLRTENLSCVRADGAALEVKIQGSVYGEDGKVGMRGRLVTKQGRCSPMRCWPAWSAASARVWPPPTTTYSTSALGTVASATGADAYRAGLGSGVGGPGPPGPVLHQAGREHLPVIEVDAGREIDVVITKGVRIDVPMATAADRGGLPRRPGPETRYLEATDDGNY